MDKTVNILQTGLGSIFDDTEDSQNENAAQPSGYMDTEDQQPSQAYVDALNWQK